MTTLQFDELLDGEAVNGYYNGAFGSLGTGPSPSLGISFSGAVARIATGLGGSGQFGTPPSSPAALFSDTVATMQRLTASQAAYAFSTWLRVTLSL